jgi:hypothetical protein
MYLFHDIIVIPISKSFTRKRVGIVAAQKDVRKLRFSFFCVSSCGLCVCLSCFCCDSCSKCPHSTHLIFLFVWGYLCCGAKAADNFSCIAFYVVTLEIRTAGPQEYVKT